MPDQLELIPLQQITFHDDLLHAVEHDGKPMVALKRICENIGLSWATQYRKLTDAPWAVVVMVNTTGPDGKRYEMASADIRTTAMWLATIDSRRVAPEARDKLVAYQNEVADVLEEYFTEGSVISQNASPWQLMRAQEKLSYRMLTDAVTNCSDYRPGDGKPFIAIQDMFHLAVTGQRAWQIKANRTEVVHYSGKAPSKAERQVAKNYLTNEELAQYEHLSELVQSRLKLEARLRNGDGSVKLGEFLVVVQEAANRMKSAFLDR